MTNNTERLHFRPLEMTDVDWLMDWENNPLNWTAGDRQVPLSRGTFQRYVNNASETLQEAGQFRWVIERKDTKTPVGLLDLYQYSERHQRAAVGILIEANARNMGFGKEALHWLINYSRDVATLHQLFAEIGSRNEGSVKLFESVGFVSVGVLKDWLRKRDYFEDVVQMQHLL